ncbi:MAG: TrmH family RNA methyltransferase [Candidatus Kapaibacterium sp.]
MHYAIPISQRLRKLIKSLHHKQFRDENEMFLAEGEKLCAEIFKSNYDADLVVIKDSPTAEVASLADRYAAKGVPIYTAPKHQFDQMCDTRSPQGIIAVVPRRDLEPDPDAPFIVLDGVQDPGNMGTIIRTADWFGYRQIVVGNEAADLFNPKTVRSTMGSLFRTKVFYAEDLADFIKSNFPEHELYGATLRAKATLQSVEPDKKFGLVMGSEAHGISKKIGRMTKNKFRIEGDNRTESLNVAIALGIVLYHFSNKLGK